MKITYNKEADALYIKLSSKKPDGTVELKENVNIDVDNKESIIGIEILNASKRLSLKSFASYQVSPELLKAI